MEEARIIGYIGNLVIGFMLARSIGNPVIISCCSELGRKERRQPSQTCTISHHAYTMSHLAYTMSFSSTCNTDARAALITSLHDLPAGSSHRAVTHNHHTHVIGSQKSNTQVYYINIGLGRVFHIILSGGYPFKNHQGISTLKFY